jgi:predicted AAA+ superfamily ATPase
MAVIVFIMIMNEIYLKNQEIALKLSFSKSILVLNDNFSYDRRMKIAQDELISILAQFNPWWRGELIADLPSWKRAAYGELKEWIVTPPAARAVMLSGARQVGKTTLVMQAIEDLIKSGVPTSNILYATFDHPLLKLAGIEAVLEAWRLREPKKDGPEYVFLDEAQFIRDWGTWVKHQVDFVKQRRIIFTGSAMPLMQSHQESGVGRWHTIKLTTLSFYEYIQIKKLSLPKLPEIKTLKEIFAWEPNQYYGTIENAALYIAHFHEYLARGGFPQTALVDTVTQAQKLLREDIVEKVLKRDMTALFGVRRILDLEHTFLYLCMHDGGLLDMQILCENLEVKRQTAQNFIELLESTHLIYRLHPFGYGKEVLRGKCKVYLSDAAISPALLLKGKNVIDDPIALSVAAESAVLKHLFARYYPQNVRFSYWRGKKDREVDLIAEVAGQVIPFEVKYQTQRASLKDLKGLAEFCQEKHTERGYVVTKSLDDFGLLPQEKKSIQILRIPATLLCYWMGEMEIRQQRQPD